MADGELDQFPAGRIDEQMQGYDAWRALANHSRVGIDLLCCLKTAPAPCVKGRYAMNPLVNYLILKFWEESTPLAHQCDEFS